MAPLEKDEIYDELKRLGIISPLEREACLNEYVEYFTSYKDTLSGRFIRRLKKVFSGSFYIPF